MTIRKDIQEILGKRFDGVLSREELACLEEWLMEDDAHVDALIEQTDAHVLMMDRGAEGAEARPVRPAQTPLMRFRILAPLAACLAIVVGGLAYNSYRARQFAARVVAHIEETSSGVSIQRRGRLVIAMIGTPIIPGDRIETTEEQSVSFTYASEESRVRIRENTSLLLEENGSGKRLFLRRGEIEASVSPQPERIPMAVLTPHAEMAVLGTVFSVTASDDTTGLRVREGTVRMGLPGGGRHENVEEGRVALAKRGSDQLVMPGKLVRTVRIQGLPPGTIVRGVAAAGEDMWIYGNHGNKRVPILVCVDPATGRIVRKVTPGKGFSPASCITWKEGLLWGFSRDGSALEGIDVSTGVIARTIPLPVTKTSSRRIFDIQGNVGWLRGTSRNELIKIDLRDGKALARITCPFLIDRIAASKTSVYAGERGWNACRIDPEDGRIAYRFMCEAESYTGDMAIGKDSRLWTLQGTEPIVHIFETE
ncbi:FecR domain-containing protein [Planctomycetota bacterium]